MADYRSMEQHLTETLGLNRRPVAITFRETPPSGVAKFTGTQPSGCSFWRIAAGGRTFYTVPSDHYNCPIGSYTHHIDLPADRAQELPQTLSLMSDIGYIRMEEVPGIPRLPQTPAAIVYSPLGDTPGEPDVVLFSDPPARLMLLQEAALRSGVGKEVSLFGRPTCMALPIALGSGMVASTGCVGNRVYTGVGEDELYVAVRGKDLPKIVQEIRMVAQANAKLVEYHQTRQQSLTAD